MKLLKDKAPLSFRVVPSPIGWLGLVAGPAGLLAILCHRERQQLVKELAVWYPSARSNDDEEILRAAAQQFDEYFHGERQVFTLPFDLHERSAFTRKILSSLYEIPFGTVVTYGELATLAGRPGAARAVGRAMAVNPLPVLIPCHRVVGAGGKMTGYSGADGIATKEWLLQFEGCKLFPQGEKKQEAVKSP
jgi:methylated-DNA-[protein]-cysteine S-methyltransferase